MPWYGLTFYLLGLLISASNDHTTRCKDDACAVRGRSCATLFVPTCLSVVYCPACIYSATGDSGIAVPFCPFSQSSLSIRAPFICPLSHSHLLFTASGCASVLAQCLRLCTQLLSRASITHLSFPDLVSPPPLRAQEQQDHAPPESWEACKAMWVPARTIPCRDPEVMRFLGSDVRGCLWFWGMIRRYLEPIRNLSYLQTSLWLGKC